MAAVLCTRCSKKWDHVGLLETHRDTYYTVQRKLSKIELMATFSDNSAQKEQAVSQLTHLDEGGNIHMVDVTDRPETIREAIAHARVRMAAETLRLIAIHYQ